MSNKPSRFAEISRSGTTPCAASDPRAFLQRLEPTRRGCDGGWFNLAVRAGCSTPVSIVASVTELARSRASDSAYQQLLRALQEHQAEALSYARECSALIEVLLQQRRGVRR